MAIIDIINSVPQEIVWIMAIFLILIFLVWIIRKSKGKSDDEEEESPLPDPKDEYDDPLIPYDETYKTLSKGSWERMGKE